MKKALTILLLSFLPFLLRSQDFEQLQRMRTLNARMELRDASTDLPIAYATVYLIPQGDTVITHFAVSNEKGIAVIDGIVQKKYELHAELIGYKPFVKEYDLKISGFENERNLGVIKLEEDRELLEAAKVSAIGNPVVVKKDTIEYNAAAYHVVDNAMLVDLLKKMPGVKVEAGGSIKVNGETVNKITVGGKAFFIKDPSMAVKNLPAKIVNKIQVIDKPKDDAAFTGVGTKDDQEKVMDIMLKDEYKKGWFGNPEKFSFVELFLDGRLNTRQIVEASWFDDQGVRYAIPVNSPKPGGSLSLFGSYNQPFGKRKRFTWTLDGSVGYDRNTSFQATGHLAGLDKDHFDYAATMARLWGNAQGDKFYGGQSGFAQSETHTLSLSLFPSLDYKTDRFSITFRGFADNRRTHYSLDKSADMNTWDFSVNTESLYTAPKGWQFNTEISYNFYRGYSEGYGAPELIWNAGIGKELGPVTLSLKAADILDQQKSLHRSVAGNYVEDVYRNVMGRYIMFGLSFNFGKMNATQANKAQRALWEMM